MIQILKWKYPVMENQTIDLLDGILEVPSVINNLLDILF